MSSHNKLRALYVSPKFKSFVDSKVKELKGQGHSDLTRADVLNALLEKIAGNTKQLSIRKKWTASRVLEKIKKDNSELLSNSFSSDNFEELIRLMRPYAKETDNVIEEEKGFEALSNEDKK